MVRRRLAKVYPRDRPDVRAVRARVYAVPVSVYGKVVLNIALVRSVHHIPVRALQIVLETNPFYFDIGNLGTKISYHSLSTVWVAIGDFFDDTILAVLEALNNGRKGYVVFDAFEYLRAGCISQLLG